MGKITTKKRILFSFRGQVTINGQIMSEKPGIFCAQNGQKLWVFGQPVGGIDCLGKLTNGQIHLGGVAVCIFFFFSGFFLNRSVNRGEGAYQFFKARCIRIFPRINA
jgi:hypothetical protein